MTKTLHVIGTRPAIITANGLALTIPPDWTIYNAPRPLYGTWSEVIPSATWEGEFRHGIHYAAVSPNDTQSARMDEENDAWALVFHSEAEVIAWADEYCRKLGIDPDLFGPEQKTTAWFNAVNREV